jgi:hypothetical protein
MDGQVTKADEIALKICMILNAPTGGCSGSNRMTVSYWDGRYLHVQHKQVTSAEQCFNVDTEMITP